MTTERFTLRPARRILGLSPYRRAALPPHVDLRLDGNEGPLPDAALLHALADASPELLRRYPDASALEHALAVRHGVAPDSVLVTAGADEALDRLCRGLGEPGGNAVGVSPSFEMIPRYAALAELELRTVPWLDGPFPRAEYLGLVDAGTRLLFVVTPNNPTGLVVGEDDVRALARAAPHALLVADLAYAEFGEDALTATVLALDAGLVLRTFSKARGLAGLRVGYALGRPDVIEAMRTAGSPFGVASLSLALAALALEEPEAALLRRVEGVRATRELVGARLRALGFVVPTSAANFVLARGPRSRTLAAHLLAQGIAVRSFHGHPLLADALRITAPAEESARRRLLAALESFPLAGGTP